MILRTSCIFILALMSNSLFIYAQTKIIAHRGFSGVAPENTLIAFKKAIASKADYFELDIHKTKNDSIVVIHDSAIDRTNSNGAKGKISSLNYNELAKLTFGYPEKFGQQYATEKLPTLREALLLAKNKIKVCIEIKVLGAEEAVLKTVNDLGMRDQVILFSFHYPVLAKIRQLDKQIPILYLISEADKLTIDYANVINANAVGVGYATRLTKEYLQFAHSNGVEIWKWTVNQEEEMQQLIELEIDGLITNFPDKALKIVHTTQK